MRSEIRHSARAAFWSLNASLQLGLLRLELSLVSLGQGFCDKLFGHVACHSLTLTPTLIDNDLVLPEHGCHWQH